MASNLFDWVFRVMMLVMAGLVTLSILGAIAAISNDSSPGGLTLRQPRPVAGDPVAEWEVQPVQRREAASGEAVPTGQRSPTVAQVVPEQPEADSGDWLEAIAYALLALCGLAAIGLLLLWRAVREWARMADELAAARLSGRG